MYSLQESVLSAQRKSYNIEKTIIIILGNKKKHLKNLARDVGIWLIKKFWRSGGSVLKDNFAKTSIWQFESNISRSTIWVLRRLDDRGGGNWNSNIKDGKDPSRDDVVAEFVKYSGMELMKENVPVDSAEAIQSIYQDPKVIMDRSLRVLAWKC